MVSEECCAGRGVAAVRHRMGGRSYTYYAMLHLREAFMEFEARGTVFGSMTKRDFLSVPCLAPPDKVVAAFEALVTPMDDLIESNTRESQQLAELRDLLLPKLVSGEVRVREAAQLGA